MSYFITIIWQRHVFESQCVNLRVGLDSRVTWSRSETEKWNDTGRDQILQEGNQISRPNTRYYHYYHNLDFNPSKPEFTIVIFIHYKPWIAVEIIDL